VRQSPAGGPRASPSGWFVRRLPVCRSRREPGSKQEAPRMLAHPSGTGVDFSTPRPDHLSTRGNALPLYRALPPIPRRSRSSTTVPAHGEARPCRHPADHPPGQRLDDALPAGGGGREPPQGAVGPDRRRGGVLQRACHSGNKGCRPFSQKAIAQAVKERSPTRKGQLPRKAPSCHSKRRAFSGG
jgi:hypothetical protein